MSFIGRTWELARPILVDPRPYVAAVELESHCLVVPLVQEAGVLDLY